MSEYCKNCKELQREIEKAKEENIRLFPAGIELNESREFFQRKFWNADKSRDSWREQAEHYKQALDEIEKIVTLDKTHIKYAGSTLVICDDILDIIRKAKGEE